METREDLIGLLEQFKNDHTYEGTGGDMFTNLIAFAINRPIIIVDIHQERHPALSALHHDLVFENDDPPSVPLVVVRFADHFEPEMQNYPKPI